MLVSPGSHGKSASAGFIWTEGWRVYQPTRALGLSSTKAGTITNETAIAIDACCWTALRIRCTESPHTRTSTSIGATGCMGEAEWMNTYDSDEPSSMRIFRATRRARKPRPAACRRTAACSSIDGHTARHFSSRRDCAHRRAKSPRAAACRRTAARRLRSDLSI